MGGFFQAQPVLPPSRTVSGIPSEFQPFATQLRDMLAGLLAGAPQGISEQEQGVLGQGLSGLGSAANLLGQTVGGSFLPGQGNDNPFVGSLMNALGAEQDVARRQLASAAQRSGALASTGAGGYTGLASDLESRLFDRRGSLLSGLYDAERARQYAAIPALQSVFGNMLGFAGYPRTTGEGQVSNLLGLGTGLLGTGRGTTITGSLAPSPFASLLQGFAPFINPLMSLFGV